MKLNFITLYIALIVCAGCSATKKADNARAAHPISAERGGMSFSEAIIITQQHEREGIDAEYGWLRNKYPGYKSRGQSLIYHDKIPFDIIHIITNEGKELDVYFNISNFYGKF